MWGWPDLSLSPSAIDRTIIPLALIFRKVAGFGAIYIHPRLEWRELVKGKPGRDLRVTHAWISFSSWGWRNIMVLLFRGTRMWPCSAKGHAF